MYVEKIDLRNGLHRVHADSWILELPNWIPLKIGQCIEIHEINDGEHYDTKKSIILDGVVIRSHQGYCIASFGGMMAQIPYVKEYDDPIKLQLKL
jgi:hypothetical protein